MAESLKECHHEPFRQVIVMELLKESVVRATCITFTEIVVDTTAFQLSA